MLLVLLAQWAAGTNDTSKVLQLFRAAQAFDSADAASAVSPD